MSESMQSPMENLAGTGVLSGVGQGDTLLMTRADIESAYVLLLGRHPREKDPVEPLVGKEGAVVLRYFLGLPEFRQNAKRIQIIAKAARLVMAARQ